MIQAPGWDREGSRRQSGQLVRWACWVPRRECRQPRLLCPPTGSRAWLHLLWHPGMEENKDREQLLLFSTTFFGPVPPARCCRPATPAAAPRSHCARSCADADRDTAPIRRRLPPNCQSLVPTSTEGDGPGMVTPHATALVPLHSPPAPSTVRHPRDAQASPRCSGTWMSIFP